MEAKLHRIADFEGPEWPFDLLDSEGAQRDEAAPLDDELRRKYGYGAKARGVVVTDVADGSPAASKEIKAGSLIIEAARKPVRSAADIASAIQAAQKSGRRALLLRVETSNGDLRFVAVALPD